jgi:DNA-binding MarR family transcriptional regulator
MSEQPRREALAPEVAQTLSQLFRRLLVALPTGLPGLGQVTQEQYGVLAHLARTGGCTMGELARARGIALNSATAIVERLVVGGLVSREQVPGDRRVVRVVLTEHALPLLDGLRRAREAAMRQLLEQLDDAEVRALAAALPALAKLGQAPDLGALRLPPARPQRARRLAQRGAAAAR